MYQISVLLENPSHEYRSIHHGMQIAQAKQWASDWDSWDAKRGAIKARLIPTIPNHLDFINEYDEWLAGLEGGHR